MRKIIIAILVVTLLLAAMALSSCQDHVHSFEDKVVKPTCVTKGYTEHTCSKCGDTYNDSEITALGHIWDSSEPPKCNICGEKKKD